jgi:integrative and conjugative element protein (TIGR02256 family)
MGDLHSSSQSVEDEDKLPPAIGAAVAQLRAGFPGEAIPALHWNASYVATPLTVDVELPGRGPVGGVDVRKREPIVLLFNRESFPYIAPIVYSDRKDFPKNKFPHINVTARGTPAWFCLHRGSIDTWFAEHTVVDLVQRARGWLRDAARNRLVPEGDGFEPTRAADRLGTFVYAPSDNIGGILGHWTEQGGTAGYSVVSFELLDDESMAEIGASGYSVRQVSAVATDAYEGQKSLALAFNLLAKKPEYKGLFQRRLFGLLVWAAENEVSSEHFGELPQTLGELQAWGENHGLPLGRALADYLANDLHIFAGVPIMLAIRRPQQVLGTDSDLELLNFLVLAGGDHWPEDDTWNPAASVYLSDHRAPLTPAFAQQISAIPADGAAEPTIVFGAGALGSKVTSHLVRGGSVSIRIVDNAKISPHNLVRHVLGGRAIGLSKAEALKDELLKLYPGEADLPIEAKNASVLPCLRDAGFFDGYANLVDMTASNIVFNALRDADLPDTIRVHRAEIADRGRLGLLSIEGAARNPRLDDLQTLMFDSAIEDSAVSAWLNEVKTTRDRVGSGGLEDIQIGLSCSSATMRLADEVVSFHAAAMTRRLRPYLAKDGRSRARGAVYTSFLGEDGDSQASTRTYAPTVVIDAGCGWEIRIAAAAAEEISEHMSRHSPSETGGILVGRIGVTKKIIYVTRLVPAPPDSRGTPYVFTRGTEQLPEALDRVRSRTGGLLTYIGEWHTHPMGGSDLSDTDKHAVISLRSILDHVGLPTLVTIVTPDEIRPHLFEPTSPPVTVDPPRRRLVGFIRATFGWKLR